MVRLAGPTRLALSSMVIPYDTKTFYYTKTLLYFVARIGMALNTPEVPSGDELLHQTKSRQDMQLWICCIKDRHNSSLFQCCRKAALKNALRDVSYTPDIMYHSISLKGVLNSRWAW